MGRRRRRGGLRGSSSPRGGAGDEGEEGEREGGREGGS